MIKPTSYIAAEKLLCQRRIEYLTKIETSYLEESDRLRGADAAPYWLDEWRKEQSIIFDDVANPLTFRENISALHAKCPGNATK
jgi:hypothetical protein